MEVTRKNLLALIKAGLERNALSITALEKNAQVPKDTVRDFLRGKTQILRADKLQKILRILEPQHKVPISGTVGAETRIAYEKSDLLVDCPPGLDPYDVTAIRVEGDAMAPVFLPGWVIYYGNAPEADIVPIQGGWQVPYPPVKASPIKGDRAIESPGNPTPARDFTAFLGKPCVVKIRSGDTLLRTLRPGRAAHLFTLASYNCTEIKDVELEWAAKILFIKTE